MRPLLTSLLLFTALAAGQNQPAFEVASIKSVDPSGHPTGLPMGRRIDAGRVEYGSVGFTYLIALAYRVRSYQVFVPDSASTPRFDIVAKLPDGASLEQVPEMLQDLLIRRFKLSVHHDTREFAVYALTVGKDGPKLTPKPPDYNPVAGSQIHPLTMANYVRSLALDRPVLDMTGLQGEFLIDVSQVNQAIMDARERTRTPSPPDAPTINPLDPMENGIFAIVRKLGLKLEARKSPLPVIVVDHVDKLPSEN
jgi:uncharacterized protein (TIGR03435 family)